jgi:hypothetical protein
MYTNINTDHGIEIIGKWLELHKTELPVSFPIEFIVEGLKIVMTRNVFEFGDSSWLQKNGTAMGTAAACIYAEIYYSYHEETSILAPTHNHQLLFLARYIDDAFMIQDVEPGSLDRLVEDFNSFGPEGKRLQWEFTVPSREVNFLDLTISVNENGRVSFRTFQKPMNLHLFIPSHSAHAPGVMKSVIYSQLRRFWLQNSDVKHFQSVAGDFYKHLRARGYSSEYLSEQFRQVAHKLGHTAKHVTRVKKCSESAAFFHLQYHPNQISKQYIRRVYQKEYAEPLALSTQRLIVANSRAPNLRDRVCRSVLTMPEGKSIQDSISNLQKGASTLTGEE